MSKDVNQNVHDINNKIKYERTNKFTNITINIRHSQYKRLIPEVLKFAINRKILNQKYVSSLRFILIITG